MKRPRRIVTYGINIYLHLQCSYIYVCQQCYRRGELGLESTGIVRKDSNESERGLANDRWAPAALSGLNWGNQRKLITLLSGKVETGGEWQAQHPNMRKSLSIVSVHCSKVRLLWTFDFLHFSFFLPFVLFFHTIVVNHPVKFHLVHRLCWLHYLQLLVLFFNFTALK